MAILFEHLFSDIILERGSDYFTAGAIRHLKREHKQIWATVQGAEDYAVYIELKDDGLESLDCNCPYFLDGHNCKHLAAVLYALGQEPGEDGQQEVRSDFSLALLMKVRTLCIVAFLSGCILDLEKEYSAIILVSGPMC